MNKKEKLLTKVMARIDEAILDIQSKNYIPIVNIALIAGACAKQVSMVRAIKSNG